MQRWLRPPATSHQPPASGTLVVSLPDTDRNRQRSSTKRKKEEEVIDGKIRQLATLSGNMNDFSKHGIVRMAMRKWRKEEDENLKDRMSAREKETDQNVLMLTFIFVFENCFCSTVFKQ